MSKPSKNKKNKIPKITEEEYAAYLSTLRNMSEGENVAVPINTEEKKKTE